VDNATIHLEDTVVMKGIEIPVQTWIMKDITIPVQTWTGPEGSRSMRLPDFKTFDT